MRKSLIAQSIAAMVAGLGLVAVANAAVVGPAGVNVGGVDPATKLVVNTDGLGHINLVPYYSTANGNDTYINITNTDTKNGKAVKVRFRGAANSDDVFDITVLLSPGDSWAAAVTKDAASGLPKLVHNDKTCTLPASVQQNFVTSRLDSTLDDAGKAKQASEGYVEILNMADIPTGTALYTAIKHVSGVAPCTATPLNALFTDSTDYAGATGKGLAVPTTGLMTNWTIINVPKASSWSGAAVAVEARTAAGVHGYGNVVLFPQASTPIANADPYTSDPLLRALSGPALSAAQYDFPDLSTPYLNADLGGAAGAPLVQAETLTAALAVKSVTNEFVTDAGLLGKTDWVFSMPTRRYSVAMDYATGNAEYTALATNFFTATNVTKEGRTLCVKGISTASPAPTTVEPDNRINAVTADREERFLESATEFVVSPGEPAAPLTFCGEVSVLTYNAEGETSALGAEITKKDITMAYVNGWMRIATPGLGSGLPIIGSALMELYNANAAAGTAGGYGLSFPHRATR